ncbi:MAG: hypothetical protein ACLQFI_16725 [Methylocella sp.]
MRRHGHLLLSNKYYEMFNKNSSPRDYEGLHTGIGRRRISRFLNNLDRPHVVRQSLAAGYAANSTVSKRHLQRRLGVFGKEDLDAVLRAVRLQLGL